VEIVGIRNIIQSLVQVNDWEWGLNIPTMLSMIIVGWTYPWFLPLQ